MAEVKEKVIVFLKKVLIAFPTLYVAQQYQGDGKFKYSAKFIVTPGSVNDQKVKAGILKAATQAWGAKAATYLAEIVGQKQTYCYLSGDMKTHDGYKGNMILSANRRLADRAPLVIDQAMNPLTQASGLPYSGAVVNAKVEFWVQDNASGKGMRAGLITVQFDSHGRAFGGASEATDEGFAEVAETAEDFV